MNMEVPHIKKNISRFVPHKKQHKSFLKCCLCYNKNLLLGIKFYMSVLVHQFHLIVRYVIIVRFG